MGVPIEMLAKAGPTKRELLGRDRWCERLSFSSEPAY